MVWKIGLAALSTIAVIITAMIGNFLHTDAHYQHARVEGFTRADYSAFDRNFTLEHRICNIGLKASDLCFTPAKFGHKVRIGHPWPKRMPAAPAELPVLLVTDLKTKGYRTYRVGLTLYLIDSNRDVVLESLDLSKPEFKLALEREPTVASAARTDPVAKTQNLR